jgi:hypothetical protein
LVPRRRRLDQDIGDGCPPEDSQLQADRRCTFLAFHPASDNCHVEIRGDAVIEPDMDYVFADRIGAKYDFDLRTFDASEMTSRSVVEK